MWTSAGLSTGSHLLTGEGKGGKKVVSRSFRRLRRISRIWGLRVFGL